MALFTSQQEAVQASLEEGWQTWHYLVQRHKLHTTHLANGISAQHNVHTETVCIAQVSAVVVQDESTGRRETQEARAANVRVHNTTVECDSLHCHIWYC